MLSSNLIRRAPASVSTAYFFKNATTFGGAQKSLKLPDINSAWTGLNGLYIKPDGREFYLTSNTADVVIQISLTNPYDLWSWTGTKTFSVVSQEGGSQAVTLSADGTKMHVMGTTGDDVNQYTLSTPWDVTTATYSGVWKQPATVDGAPYGLTWNSSGTRFYILGTTNDLIRQFNVSSPFDVLSTVTLHTTTFSLASHETSGRGIFITPDSSYVYISGVSSDAIKRFTLTNESNIGSLSSPQILTIDSTPYYSLSVGSIALSSDGTSLFAIESSASILYELKLQTAWDLTSYVTRLSGSVFDLTPNIASALRPTEYFMKSDGISGIGLKNSTDNLLLDLSFSTPHDPFTMSVSATTKSIDTFGSGSVVGLNVHPNGTYVYWIDSTTDNIYQLRLNTDWDITSAASTVTTYSISSVETAGVSMWFTNDGSYLWLYGDGNDALRRFTLATPYMINTISTSTVWTSANFPISLINKTYVVMSKDGKHLYLANDVTLWHLVMSTPFDPNTASLAELIGIEGVVESALWDQMVLKDDGTMMYFFDATNFISKVQLA